MPAANDLAHEATVKYGWSFRALVGGEVFVRGRLHGTGHIAGPVIVCGRPFSLADRPVHLDPDADSITLEKTLTQLDGRFSLLALGREQWVLATDLLGAGGAFLAQTRRGPVVASSLGETASLVEDLGYDAIGVVAALVGSVSIGGTSPFDGIRRLQGGEYAILSLNSDRPPVVRKYADAAQVLVSGPERRGSTHELRELLMAAVAREDPDHNTGLLLTRGRDSQAIGHTLSPSARATVTAFTYGGWRSSDRRGSRTAARRIGVTHRRVGPLTHRLRDHFHMISAYGGGLTGMQVSQHLAGVTRVSRHVTKVLVGFLAGPLTGHPFSTSPERQVRMLMSRQMPWRTTAGIRFNKEFPDEMDEIRAALTALLHGYQDLPPGRATTLVELTHRQACYISGAFGLMNHYVEVATPFFFRPLMQYLLTLRPDDLEKQQLYTEMLKENGFGSREENVGPIDVAASWVNQRTGGSYLTVNWPRVIARERDWLRNQLCSLGEDRIARLGWSSLETESSLPLALMALPLVQTKVRPSVPPISAVSQCK